MNRYIDPLADFSFKRIFGSEPNKDLLISFINSVFRGRKRVVDLVYNKNEFPGDASDIGTVVLDLTCTGSEGEIFLIEVQRRSQRSLKSRMLYYASKLISDQAPKGRRSEWDYELSEVFVIVLMDGFSMPGGNGGSYLYDIALCNRDSGELFYEGYGFFFLELVNFDRESEEIESDLDKWLYVLTRLSKMDKLPVFLRKSVFEKLFDVAEYGQLSKKERTMYDVSLKRRWDAYTAKLEELEEKAAREAALREERAGGREEGRAEGREEGRVEGRVEGREEGMVIGEAKAMAVGIRKLLKSGKFTELEIAGLMDVEVQLVRGIAASLDN